MTSVTWHQVQQALTACIAKHPIVDQVLPKESGPLVELLGIMACQRCDELRADQVRHECIEAVQTWTGQQAPS